MPKKISDAELDDIVAVSPGWPNKNVCSDKAAIRPLDTDYRPLVIWSLRDSHRPPRTTFPFLRNRSPFVKASDNRFIIANRSVTTDVFSMHTGRMKLTICHRKPGHV